MRRLPRGLKEAVGLLLAYNGYEYVRALCGQADGTARANAEQIVRVERSLHVAGEGAVQRWALGHPSFVQLLDIFYGTAHFIAPAAVLVMLWRRRPEQYRLWRDRLIAITLLALIGFWLWPVAPPRLLPSHYGFVDTDAVLGGMGPLGSGPGKDLNVNAAMPSLHVGWALWCASAVAATAGRRVRTTGRATARHLARKWAAYAFPLFTFLTVTATGNHYWLDAVGGLVVDWAGYAVGGGLVAAGLARIARLRPRTRSATLATDGS